MKALQALLDGYYRLLRILVGLMMAGLIIPVAMQVLARPLDIPLIGEVRFVPRHLWTEEVALFLFIWIIMLGSVIAVREKTHFEVDLLPGEHPIIPVMLRDPKLAQEMAQRLDARGVFVAPFSFPVVPKGQDWKITQLTIEGQEQLQAKTSLRKF